MVETNKTSKNPTNFIPTILMPLPDHDFDPTESGIPWDACTSRGWRIEFSTEHGAIPQADAHKLTGPLSEFVTAGAKTRAAYQRMTQDPAYQHPIPYVDIDPNRYKALLLPGGDALRMRQYLESTELRSKVLQFYQQEVLIGAICHGILVLTRTIDPLTGRSVLYGHKVTALPRSLDRLAYRIDSLVLKHGYIMYPSCVTEEVRACLEHSNDFIAGPGILAPYVVTDGNLITSRWYMDAELFAERFVNELQSRMS
jgi:putative intracellular protease/amidase